MYSICVCCGPKGHFTGKSDTNKSSLRCIVVRYDCIFMQFYNCHVAAIMLYICDTAAGDTDSLETFLL